MTGQFTLSAEKDLEIQHRIGTTNLTNAGGSSTGFGTEVFTEVRIWQRDAQEVEVVVGTLSVVDEKAAETENTDMGSANTWQTRTLNTTRRNTITGASLASNVITLPAGTYRARAIAPAYRVSYNKCRLRDTTNSVTLAVGTPERAHNGGSDGFISVHSLIDGDWFTLTGEADIELQHWCEVANGSTGGGLDNSTGNGEVARYASVVIEKMSV